ncbi:alpha-glucoside-specific PTS transporter subunit IIBC [Clostridium lacusfryxellense]|uniref:alpha-glucoside-specific PTS transporter subunit IIBC n=1 Tax=Clostridium lacusfryxellense TaxID=205328 RepID=UPI001C0E18F3|nr:alpha-glucoside-specific PTS transporter subunit IIBC [Clostridium lacusfryxellense]MBU3109996.1 alpha-glucoside-specific PTS transporter subunit IIBC [Clostridium lacusfryxellense]
MMKKIQRFGGAMFTPTLLFAFAGIAVGFSILFKNTEVMGSLADPSGNWYKVWDVIASGSWAIFNQLPLLFVIGLPVGLATKQNARACLEALVIYLTFNYFLSSILTYWGASFGVNMKMEVGNSSGLTMIAGIKTLDTGMIGALIVAGIVVYIHNKYFDTNMPDVLGIFRGSSFIVMIGFFLMLPLALAFATLWPKVQIGIRSMQGFFISSGEFGIWVYSFLERILIPTGLHHFIYAPFVYDNAVVQGGTAVYWPTHLKEFATTAKSLKEMYPIGFSLSGMTKVFGSIGIALAFYKTAKPEKRKIVAGLMIPVALTAIFTGITEPIEFTFLFIAPVLFLVHSLLAATVATISFHFGVVGDFGGGLINWFALNWIPLGKYHLNTYIIQVIIGLIFSAIWYFVFVFLIRKFNFKTPGRESDDEEAKLYSKKEYKEMKEQEKGDLSKTSKTNSKKSKNANSEKAALFLEALGGKDNIEDVTNCATRLRLTIKDPSIIAPLSVFKKAGAYGLVKNKDAIQVIVGLSVATVREEFENLL